MYKIDELITKLCPNGVEYKKLENCCNILDNKRKPVTKSARIKGNYPYYGANGIQDYVSDYLFDGKFILVGEDGSVINENGNPIVTWAEGKIWVNNHAHIIEQIDDILLRYLFYYLQTINVKSLVHGNIPKLNQRDFRQLLIAVPPLEIQSEIVDILDNFTKCTLELTSELLSELINRQKQYEYYKQKMLNFSKNDSNVEWVTLGTYCKKLKGTAITARKMKEIEKENGNLKIFAGGKTVITTDENNIPKEDIIKVPTIIVQSRGIIDFIYYDQPCSYKKEMWSYTTENIVTLKFIYYYLKSNVEFFRQKGNQMGSMPQISLAITQKYKIPIPKYEEQEKIVNILDKFDKLCHDISKGLPAEIDARKKQYEYYRNKLLAFKELK